MVVVVVVVVIVAVVMVVVVDVIVVGVEKEDEGVFEMRRWQKWTLPDAHGSVKVCEAELGHSLAPMEVLKCGL